jgi:hypothetical protein
VALRFFLAFFSRRTLGRLSPRGSIAVRPGLSIPLRPAFLPFTDPLFPDNNRPGGLRNRRDEGFLPRTGNLFEEVCETLEHRFGVRGG